MFVFVINAFRFLDVVFVINVIGVAFKALDALGLI
jgi:hypothetical protein